MNIVTKMIRHWLFFPGLGEYKLHRKDNGPAIEHTNGKKEWYKEGKLHREDGPAIEDPNLPPGQAKKWYWDGEEMTEEKWKKKKEDKKEIKSTAKKTRKKKKE